MINEQDMAHKAIGVNPNPLTIDHFYSMWTFVAYIRLHTFIMKPMKDEFDVDVTLSGSECGHQCIHNRLHFQNIKLLTIMSTTTRIDMCKLYTIKKCLY